ncbi:MAG TPA: DUF3052 domain-containing protein [Actinomycetota bacterium]|nr:DUF3052 domain-containing protein [Actinomycetota bacterium]
MDAAVSAGAGYSGTPLARRLGIKDGHAVHFARAPEGFAASLGLSDDVEVRARARGPLDVVVLFATRRTDLERRFAALARVLDPAGALWVAWPKRSSGVDTDLTEGVVQRVGLDAGLVDNKVCAIDATWSGLRFVYRVADRPAR